MRSPLALTLLIVCSTGLGCNARYDGTSPTVPNGNGQTTQQPEDTSSGEAISESDAGWPAGEDPQQSFAALAEEARSIFDSFELVEETMFYPLGFTKLKRIVSELEHELHQDSEPTTGVIRVVYTKNFTILHKTREAAEVDHEVYPFNPMQTAEAMKGPLNVQQTPITLEMTYTLKGDRWVRTGLTVEPAHKETSDPPGQMNIP